MNFELFDESIRQAVFQCGEELAPEYVLDEEKANKLWKFCERSHDLMALTESTGFHVEYLPRTQSLIVSQDCPEMVVSIGSAADPRNTEAWLVELIDQVDRLSFEPTEDDDGIRMVFMFQNLWVPA